MKKFCGDVWDSKRYEDDDNQSLVSYFLIDISYLFRFLLFVSLSAPSQLLELQVCENNHFQISLSTNFRHGI